MRTCPAPPGLKNSPGVTKTRFACSSFRAKTIPDRPSSRTLSQTKKPPAGQTHPYHFEVFALDTRLGIDPVKADRTTVVNAMKGHVLAEGEIIGLYTGK